ncbi:MAG: site-specific integrase [Nitrospinae bacterium]|nr:site-specific integrase [Nitrospinota bacterium]
MNTAGRRGSVLNLQWADVDFENRWVVFRKTKSGKPVGVPMTGHCLQTFLELREARDRMIAQPPTDYVFIKDDGTPRKLNNVSAAFRKLCKLAGIVDFHFHDLRHDCGTKLRKAGVPLAEIKDWMGHSDISMTLRYAHACGDSGLRDAAKRLEQVRER